MLQRPGWRPRARNSSASQALAPGALASNGLASDGRLAIRHRIRAPLKLALPERRISQQGTPDRSAATASRRVAVKSSAAGSPQISPTTAQRPEHLTPSSIAHSAERASRASTWTRSDEANPGGWTRPLSRIAIRSCTHSSGFDSSSCASTNPAQPPSRGCTAKTSLSVGLDGLGTLPDSPALVGSGSRWTGRGGAVPPAPATRESSAATRLETFMFYLCSHSRESGMRVKPATRPRPESVRFRPPPDA